MKKDLKKGKGQKFFVLLPMLLLMMALTGCASNADTLMSPGPTINSTQMPGNQLKEDMQDMIPGMSPETSVSPTTDMPVNSSNVPDTIDKSRKVSDEMEESIDLLSEVEDAAVVVIGNQALVGIEFEKQYQGCLDERLKKMIFTRAQTISKGVNEVFITNDPAVYEQIDALADSMETAASLADITARFTQISQSLTPYKA